MLKNSIIVIAKYFFILIFSFITLHFRQIILKLIIQECSCLHIAWLIVGT